jgi:hypothetical protein
VLSVLFISFLDLVLTHHVGINMFFHTTFRGRVENHSMVSTQFSTSLPAAHHFPASLGRMLSSSDMYVLIYCFLKCLIVVSVSIF